MSDDDDEDTTKKRRADSVQNKKPVSFVFEVESGEALTQEQKPSVSQAIYAFVEGARRGKARRHGRRAASKSPIPNSQKPLRPTALEPTGPMQMPVFKEAHEGSGLRSDELATLPFRRLLLAGEADEQAQKEEAVEPPARLSDGSQERAAEQTELSAAGDRNTQGHAARRPWRVGPFWLVVACLLGMAGMWALPRFLEGDSKGEAWTRPSGEAIRAEDISSLSKGEASAPPKREAEPAQLSTAKPEAQNPALSEAKAEVKREEAAPEKNAPKKKAMLAPAPKAPKNEGLIEAAPRAKSPRKTSAPPKPTLIFE